MPASRLASLALLTALTAWGALAPIGGRGTARAQEPEQPAAAPASAQQASTAGDVPPVLIPWPMEGEGGDEDDELIPLLAPPPTRSGSGARPSLDTGAAPASPRAPGVAASAASGASTAPGATKQPPPGGLSESELDILLPQLRAPAVGARVAVTEMTPPTDDVRRWQFEKVEGLTWESEEALQEGEWVVLRGKVDVRAGIERIRADEIRLNVTTRLLEAEGNVVLDRLDSRLTGRRLEYDTATNTGLMYDALGFTGDELSFTADIAEKVSENKYVLRGATFTSCTQPSPIWQVNATKAVVEVDHFVYLWNPRVVFGHIPLSYLPWVAFPIKQQRTTGFMIPRMSSSSNRGFSVSEEFFWAINRSTDLAVGGTWWDKYGWRADAQARWFLPGMSEFGYIEGIYLKANDGEEDIGLDTERYLIDWEHRQRLGQWDLTFTGEIGTDPLVDELFPGGGRSTTTTFAADRSPVLNQRLTLQRRWGKHSLNILMENDERGTAVALSSFEVPEPGLVLPEFIRPIEGTNIDVNRSLPVAEWRAAGIQIGGKRWAVLDLEGSVGALRRGRETEYEYDVFDDGVRRTVRVKPSSADHDYQRADFYPQFSFPMGGSFLRVIPEVNVRGTWWSRIENDPIPATLAVEQVPAVQTFPDITPIQSFEYGKTEGIDEDTFLWAWDAGMRVEGPDFERIFNADAEPGQKKWQHLVEPSLEYVYAPELDNVNLIQGDQRRSHYQQRFPTETTVGGTPLLKEGGTNEVRLRLVNTLRSKRMVPAGSTPEQPRDLVIWTLSSTWDLDRDEQEAAFDGPIHAVPLDCNGDGDVRDTGEGAGARCPRLETARIGNVQSDFNIRPTELIHFGLRNTYDTLADEITQTSLVGGLDWEHGYADIAYSSTRDRKTASATSTEVSLTGEHWFYKGGRYRIGYDVTRELDSTSNTTNTPWIYRRLVLSYYNQCVGLSLSWEDDAHRSIDREQEWTFLVSLKGGGNFLRYRYRDDRSP